MRGASGHAGGFYGMIVSGFDVGNVMRFNGCDSGGRNRRSCC